MSGHSKWSTIKRKKEKTDNARAKVFTKIGREIAVVVREGGADPASNSKLKEVIAKAKANNVPNDNKYVTAYDPGSGLVSQATYDALINSKKAKKLELGVNAAGEVVFKHPYKAFGRAAKEYKKVWKYGDKELKMKHLSRTFYMDYATDEYAEIVIGTIPELTGDANIYQEILEIYSHSYNKHR